MKNQKNGEEFICDEKMFVFRKKLLDYYIKNYQKKFEDCLFITMEENNLKFKICDKKQKEDLTK